MTSRRRKPSTGQSLASRSSPRNLAVTFASRSARPVKDALDTLACFAVGKPVLVEETFPLACSPKELEEFIEGSREHAAGWLGFYWGKPPEELRRSKTISDALTLGWLELFEKEAKALEK